MDDSQAHFSFVHEEPKLIFTFSGKLDQNFFLSSWHQALELQSRYKPKLLIINAKDVTDCDSLGLALILELEKRQRLAKGEFTIQNVPERVSKTLSFLEEQKSCKVFSAEQPNFIVKTGMSLSSILLGVKENIIFLGMIIRYFFALFYNIKRKSGIKWDDFWRIVYDIGPRVLPIIVLLGFLIGLISTFQSATPLGRFGAQIYIIDLVSLGLIREMGPLITAVLVAGRTASAFAAEIGTMKINQEIDALTTMGIEPVEFLVMPRIIAGLMLTPILSLFLIFAGLVGCFLVMLSLQYGFGVFISEMQNTVTLTDFFSGLIKTFVFGAVISGIGCLHGIKTSYGASAVGYSTTSAVVSGLVMLVVIDGIFATIYYFLGI